MFAYAQLNRDATLSVMAVNESGESAKIKRASAKLENARLRAVGSRRALLEQ